MNPTLAAMAHCEGSLANTGESTAAHLAHPSILFVKGNAERIRNDEVLWSPDALNDDLGRKFGPICSDG